MKKLKMPPKADAYTQIIAVRKTPELISLERQRCIEKYMKEYEIKRSVDLIMNLQLRELHMNKYKRTK